MLFFGTEFCFFVCRPKKILQFIAPKFILLRSSLEDLRRFSVHGPQRCFVVLTGEKLKKKHVDGYVLSNVGHKRQGS